MKIHDLAVQQPIFDQGNKTSTSDMSTDWKLIELSQLVKEFISGGTPSTKRAELWNGSVPWTTSATISVDDTTLGTAERFITEQGLQESASHLVPKESVLIGTRVGVGKAVVNLIDIAISQDLTGMVLDTEQVQPEFVAYQFKTKRVQNILDGSKRGTTIKGISRFDLQLLKLYLPPLQEQHAIAHVLQTVQDAIQTRRKEIELEYERKAALMQSLFTHGTRNKPTKQTEVGEIPENWEVSKLEELCQFLQYGTSEPCNADSDKTPVLRIPNVINGYINTRGLKYITLSEETTAALRLDIGDLLFVRTNGNREYIGRCAVFNGELKETLFASYLIRVRLKSESMLPNFVRFYTMTHKGRQFFSGKASHAADGKFNINTQTIKQVLLPIPSIEEQYEIVNVLNACDSKISSLEKELTLHEELFRALLDELMTGRLSALPLVE